MECGTELIIGLAMLRVGGDGTMIAGVGVGWVPVKQFNWVENAIGG